MRGSSGVTASPSFKGAPVPGAAVVVAPAGTAFLERVLAEVKRLHLKRSTLVVSTREDVENVVEVARRWDGHVAWLGDGSVASQVMELRNRDVRQRAYDLLCSAMKQPDKLVALGLQLGFFKPPPPSNLKKFVKPLQVSVPWFRWHYEDAGLPGRAEALPDWVMMGQVVHLRASGCTLAEARRELRIDPYRIQRASFRRTGHAAGKLDEGVFLEALMRWLRGT
jgi:hypothetical protein